MKKFDVTEYTIHTDKFANGFCGFTFVMISDLHSNEYNINLKEAAEAVKLANPDAVILAGDIFNGRRDDDTTDAENFVKELASQFPVYYGMGNHESRLKNYPDKHGTHFADVRANLEDAGVTFLENKRVYLDKNGEKAVICGLELDDIFYRHTVREVNCDLLDAHIGQADKNFYNILIAHHPKYFKAYAKWGADLVLSGHVHGGIIRLPLVGGLISTDMKPFPKYDGGIYEQEDSKMIVSRGLGTHTINVRINNRPELLVIKILAKDAQ